MHVKFVEAWSESFQRRYPSQVVPGLSSFFQLILLGNIGSLNLYDYKPSPKKIAGRESVEDDKRSGRSQTSRTSIGFRSATMLNDQSADEVKSASQAELKDMVKNGFQKCFDGLYTRWQNISDVQKVEFEKKNFKRWQFGQKRLRGEWRVACIVHSNKRATSRQTTSVFNTGASHNTRRIQKQGASNNLVQEEFRYLRKLAAQLRNCEATVLHHTLPHKLNMDNIEEGRSLTHCSLHHGHFDDPPKTAYSSDVPSAYS
ncbi:hypothetical protein TNCV_563411 [Trichonephila clavipes]|nr:hypothetical protein TNCV_563411 [Trichonephila clavipes]